MVLALNTTRLEDWEDVCGELADRVLKAFGDREGDMLYLAPADKGALIPSYARRKRWTFHMVAMLDGRVYDPWNRKAQKLKRYLASVFGDQEIVASLNGIDFYEGPANLCPLTKAGQSSLPAGPGGMMPSASPE